MREIRLSGSEGGGAGYPTGPSYPYRSAAATRQSPPNSGTYFGRRCYMRDAAGSISKPRFAVPIAIRQ